MKISIWNLLSVLGLIAIVGVGLLVLQFFINPYNGLNPFPPPTLPPLVVLPTSTPTLKSLPATWTPEPEEIIESTLLPTSTPLASPTGFTLPSFTPTFTPTITSSPTPIASATPTPGDDQAAWREQSPKDGTVLSPGQDFDMRWTVENIGINRWSSDYYYKYASGWDGYKIKKYNLSKSVKTGDEIVLIVDVNAPKKPGSYSMVWKLYNDDGEAFYTVNFSFSVK